MVWQVAIPALASLAGGLIGSSGAKSAAREQSRAAQAGVDEQRRQFDASMARSEPFHQFGLQGLEELGRLYGIATPGNASPGAPDLSRFYKSPDYQFRMNEGLTGINQSAAARGGALSGNALRGGISYAGNLASGEFGNYRNFLSGLMRGGEQTTNTMNTMGTNFGNAAAAGAGAAGDARASGVMGNANAWTGALNNIGQLAMIYGMNRPQARVNSSNLTLNDPRLTP